MPKFLHSRDQGGQPGSLATTQRSTPLLVGAIVAAGVVFICGLWAMAFFLIGSEQRTAITHARAEAGNLSAAFQDEVRRMLDQVSGAMELVAQRMRVERGAFDIHEWANEIPLLSAAAIQASIIGPDGTLLSTTLDPHPKPIDLSDREHFRIHLDGTYHGLFISKPIIGRVSGKATIQITMRVDTADGRFLGVIVFSVVPAQFTTLHKSINLGSGGILALFGTDNVLRARFDANSPDGSPSAGASVIPRLARADADDTQELVHITESPVDHIVRIYSDRRLAGYPLFVAVGLDLNEVLAPSRVFAREIEATATIVTLLLCGLLTVLVIEVRRRGRHEMQLAKERSALTGDIILRQQVEQQLRDSEQRFQDIAEVSGDWIWESDADHRFVFISGKASIRPVAKAGAFTACRR